MDIPTQDSEESSFRQNFDRKVVEYEEQHPGYRRKPWTQKRVIEVINNLKQSRVTMKNRGKMAPMEYYWMSKYEVMTTNNEEHLIFKRKTIQTPTIRIIPREEYFDVLSAIHKACGHGGRDKMINKFNNQYYIPKKAVEIFTSLCPTCEGRRNNLKKVIVSHNFNIRGIVQILDFQSFADGKYKWLLKYQDCNTKFLSLRPLKTNQTNEVAEELMKIFLTFGAPYILHSINGQEFIAQVIKEITLMWPVCKIIYGNPEPPQTQGSVEQDNQDVLKMLQSWMKDNKSMNWSIGCYFIQYQINASSHHVTGKSSYKALFGSEPEAGLSSSTIPPSVLKNIKTEDQLKNLSDQQLYSESNNMPSQNRNKQQFGVKNPSENSNEQKFSDKISSQNSNEQKFCDNISSQISNEQKFSDKITSQNCNEHQFVDKVPSQNINKQQVNSDNGPSHNSEVDIKNEIEWNPADDDMSENTNNIYENPHAVFLKETVCENEEDTNPFQRIEEHRGIKREPENIEDNQAKKVPPLAVGDTVFVTVPKADRGPLKIKIIKAKIVDFQNKVYRVATKTGIIKNWFARHDLEVTSDDYEDVISYTPISMSEAIKDPSVIVHLHKCICRPALNQCRNNRCACYKNKFLCGPKCHSNMICINK